MIRSEDASSQHVALELWRAGIGGWLIVFAPMLLTVGYMISLSGERQNGQIRFALMRSGIAVLHFQGLRRSTGRRNHFSDRLCGIRVTYDDPLSIVKYAAGGRTGILSDWEAHLQWKL